MLDTDELKKSRISHQVQQLPLQYPLMPGTEVLQSQMMSVAVEGVEKEGFCGGRQITGQVYFSCVLLVQREWGPLLYLDTTNILFIGHIVAAQ